MKFQKLEFDSFYKCVLNFDDLGTGRKGKKVLVGDSDDARSSHFSFAANIRHNWPSWNEVKFTNGEVLYLPSATIRGKRVYVFLWNEMTADLWFQQIERTKILDWLQTAQPQDVIALANLIVELTGSECRICQHPDFAIFSAQPIQIEIRKLSLSQLRALTSLIDPHVSAESVKFAKAA
jgi:hypothetical protein